MNKQKTEQIHEYVAIDTNNNISFPVKDKEQLIENLAHYYLDEVEHSKRRTRRMVQFDIYQIPDDFDYMTCPCMVKYIKEFGTLIETRNATVELPGFGCTIKNHKWGNPKKINQYMQEYTCKQCKQTKIMMDFNDCPICHSEIQPMIWTIKPYKNI